MRRLPCMLTVAACAMLSATSGRAQEPVRGPACELNRSYFLVQQAETYFIGAHEEDSQEARDEMRENAKRSLLEALDRGEVENPAVWYFLGRIYHMEDDIAGMDSSFARVERLAPDCAEDTDYYRQLTWVPLINAAVDSLQGGAFEGAKTVLREAMTIREDDNLAHYYLARIFGNEGEFDSAMVHFREVIDLGPMEAEERQENYLTSLRSMAELFSGFSEWDSAAAYYERLREAGSTDPSVLVRLADVYANAGDEARALEMYGSVLERRDQMEADALFEVGQALFLTERFNLAVEAFEAGFEKNPYSLPAGYDLANTYRALAQSDAVSPTEQREAATAMKEIAQALVEADPLSAEALRLLAAANQILSNTDETDRALARVDELPVEMEVYYAEPSGGMFSIQGQFRNPRNRDAVVPEITFEFLTADGEVVETKTAGGETVEANGASRFSVTATGQGIVGYRYQIGS